MAALCERDRAVPASRSLESISLFFRYALSLTAWKQVGVTKWPLRANPSSGNLHPTEGYALLPAIEQLGETSAVYHYAPKEHALERRAVLGWRLVFLDGVSNSTLSSLLGLDRDEDFAEAESARKLSCSC